VSQAGVGGGRTHAWAQRRLAAVEAKLNGGNSARLTLGELQSSIHPDVKKPLSMSDLTDIVLGGRDSLRRQLPERGLTVGQQVDVLVEQATDPNILGRTYLGWAPWY